MSGVLCFLAAAGAKDAAAAVIFSQTAPGNDGIFSDVDDLSYQLADDFTIDASTTAKSVTWRGAYGATGRGSPVAPFKFTLTIYGDNGNVPDQANVISTTGITFPSLASAVATGATQGGGAEYEFAATIPAASLTAGTKYWFSVLADTRSDLNHNFFWSTQMTPGETLASRYLPSGQYSTGGYAANMSFSVSDAPVATPEPAGAALLACAGAGGLLRRRRRLAL
jgi:hypothetical protein